MSEANNTFPFPGMEDNEELDISAIFGAASTSDINPFDAQIEQSEQPAVSPEQSQTVSQPKPEQPSAPQTQTQRPTPAAPVNPIAAAINQQEAKVNQTAAKSLFEKLPIFASYLRLWQCQG